MNNCTLVGLGILLLAPSVWAAPGTEDARNRAQQIACASNLKQLSLGLIEYVQDHDERYPDAHHWVNVLMPYVKNVGLFHDPATPASHKWSYAFNRNLSMKPLARLGMPASTVALFDSDKATKNASDTGQSVPFPGRHRGGNNFAFADGHIKWLRAGSKPSFTLDGAPAP